MHLIHHQFSVKKHTFYHEIQTCNEGGVDEIDKLNKRQQQVLNNFLESGNIDYQTGKTNFHFSLPKCKVIATSNSIENLAKPFLSRFGEPIHIPPYTFEEFQEISIRLLDNRYNIPIDVAIAIADVAWNNLNIKNVRILEHVGSRIRKDDRAEDIEKLIATMIKYGQINNAYQEIKHAIWYFVNLYRSAKSAGMNVQKIVKLLNIAGDRLPSVEHRYEVIQKQNNRLESILRTQAKEFQNLTTQIYNLFFFVLTLYLFVC